MLEVGTVVRTRADDPDDVVEGVLICPQLECMREHPIIDGIPIIVVDIRAYMQSQLSQIISRDDLSPVIDGLLCDCLGPGSEFERNRYHLSSYARTHYGDLDPESPLPREHALPALLARGFDMLAGPPAGVWLDVGCSVGRGTFELAGRTGELVLGIDLNMGMLRIAQHVATTGRVRHPLRRGGVVYDWRDYPVAAPGRALVEFWACDAMALPFANDSFAGALSCNVLDCVASPVAHLLELGRVIAPAGQAIVTTPYDWSTNATPMEGWIGGHSQRSDNRGDSVREMRRILSADAPTHSQTRMVVTGDVETVPWHVYVHDRASMTYQVHLVVTRKPG